MKQTYLKKLIIGSVALTALFGSTTLFPLGQSAHAQTMTANTQMSVKAEHERDHHGRRWPIVEESATLLGVDHEAMIKSLKSGKSIVEVAAEKGINEADLTVKLQQLRVGKIEAAVKDGKLTAEQGERMKQNLSQHLKFILNEKNWFENQNGRSKRHHHGLKPDPEKLAKSLGISESDLNAQLKAGKSLAEIAKSKGISKDKLVASIKEQLTPSIEKLIDRKKNAE
ncbi:hypothetical protein GK047_05045 [Paenibacillus sp. SYP-B3998]|uniref:LysM domain-containing protein n=1 Tax=Paenibacillus sp. SYP-B3998 TaxID=2678564 RepID=A0A6G3ZT52_9BACL|nr:hypothetical protein [Paenibacillus sp. SYP-B3998]NEW05383.1 hypothetical protein [Paenibacillus sp. SYP-B3998]